MSTLDLRPVQTLEVPLSPDEAYRRLASLLQGANPRVTGQTVKNHMLLTLNTPTRHFYSPWLQLEVRAEVGTEQTRVKGRFSPKPSLWMGFLLAYLALGTIALFGALFGTSQYMVDSAPTALWALPICAALAATLFTATRIGQGLARPEMTELWSVVTDSLAVTPA